MSNYLRGKSANTLARWPHALPCTHASAQNGSDTGALAAAQPILRPIPETASLIHDPLSLKMSGCVLVSVRVSERDESISVRVRAGPHACAFTQTAPRQTDKTLCHGISSLTLSRVLFALCNHLRSPAKGLHLSALSAPKRFQLSAPKQVSMSHQWNHQLSAPKRFLQ